MYSASDSAKTKSYGFCSGSTTLSESLLEALPTHLLFTPPATTVTLVSFKAWHQTLIVYHEHNAYKFLYIEGVKDAILRPQGKTDFALLLWAPPNRNLVQTLPVDLRTTAAPSLLIQINSNSLLETASLDVQLRLPTSTTPVPFPLCSLLVCTLGPVNCAKHGNFLKSGPDIIHYLYISKPYNPLSSSLSVLRLVCMII